MPDVASPHPLRRALPEVEARISVTPRQWACPRRPFIAEEARALQGAMRAAGAELAIEHFFEGEPPSMEQHFGILRVARLLRMH